MPLANEFISSCPDEPWGLMRSISPDIMSGVTAAATALTTLLSQLYHICKTS